MSCATNDTTRPPREEWSRVAPRLRPTHTGSPRASDALRLRTPTDRAGLAAPATRRTTMRSRWRLPLLALVVLVAAPARAEQGVTDTEILLGGSNSFSGPLAFSGE